MELSPETAYERVKSQRRIAPMRTRLGLHKQRPGKGLRTVRETIERHEKSIEKSTKRGENR